MNRMYGCHRTLSGCNTSHLQRRDVDPTPLLPAAQPRLRELHAFGAFEQRPFEWRVLEQVADEHLPLGLEAVLVGRRVGHLAPGLKKPDRLRHVRIPYRTRRVHPRLAPAFLQPRDRGAMGAVHVKRDEIVTPPARAPGAVDMRDGPAVELQGCVWGVVEVPAVGLAVFFPAFGDVGRTQAGDAFHLAEQIVEHVAPVTEHIENDAAAFLLAVIPPGPLRRRPVALEHPVAELAAHRDDAPEERGIDQGAQLEEPGEKQLVLHDAVPDPRLLRRGSYGERIAEVLRDRLLAIDVLAGGDRLVQQPGAQLGRGGIEEQRVIGVLQRRIEVRRPARDAVRVGQLHELAFVAADQDRVGHHRVAVAQRHAPLRADRQNGADEMLIHPHAAGHAVHDDAETLLRHADSFQMPDVRCQRSDKRATDPSTSRLSCPASGGASSNPGAAGWHIQPSVVTGSSACADDDAPEHDTRHNLRPMEPSLSCQPNSGPMTAKVRSGSSKRVACPCAMPGKGRTAAKPRACRYASTCDFASARSMNSGASMRSIACARMAQAIVSLSATSGPMCGIMRPSRPRLKPTMRSPVWAITSACGRGPRPPAGAATAGAAKAGAVNAHH